MRHRALLVAALAALAGLLAGCGAKAEPTGAIAAFPAHAVDAAGAAVVVPAEPTRIVSLDAGATHVLRDLGLGNAIVETDPAHAIAVIGETPPSLVVAPGHLDAGELDRLRSATTAPLFLYGADPIEDAPQVVAQLGLAVGRGPEAAALAQRIDDGLAAVRRSVAGKPRVRTLVEGAGFTAYGPTSPAGIDVAAAGGENVVSADQPLDLTGIPGLDVAAWVALDPGGSTLVRLRTYRELAQVPAVRDGRVLQVPRDGFPVDATLPGRLRQLADDLHAPPVTTG